jgi:tubulin-specific chaperone A
MAPPSKLSVATSSVTRLVKEEASYHKELEHQQTRIKKLEESGDSENKEWELKQEVRTEKNGCTKHMPHPYIVLPI